MSPPAAGLALERRQGCLVCGAGLDYSVEARALTCSLCGEERSSAARCGAGHFVCDACHAGSARDVIERVCRAAEGSAPLAIAAALMDHPSVKMHGPEHHFLVPAALVAAWANARGIPAEERAGLLSEARRRAEAVLGGFCGFQGACGAGVGVGIFASLATGATPMSRKSWGLANGATARTLGAIARLGGPRCCKRTTWLALLTGIRVAARDLGVRMSGRAPSCAFGPANPDCLQGGCPFHPGSAQRST